jgi:carboxylesterase
MSQNLIIPSAEPFFHPGGGVGCLLVHGFTGTPKEMTWFGDHLVKEGHTVLGIRLAGHATTPEDLARTRWLDWLASVEDGINILKGCTQVQIAIGLSHLKRSWRCPPLTVFPMIPVFISQASCRSCSRK